ncbi:hypothetical protein GGS23DRAFT_579619 [Durotheca rogersii]|uniref:uncharacterized protein n=1 Tax=Durotheca rogersii TaxID=419775 RepID=UPI00222034D5|nr:uncharacterized protein GGS23DRAFT_579619 [Durotheca rogersii]KAI5860638.1 hypothetical protein GGS23DRAFT_579619 [Durotheca rogersii]
MTDMPGRTSPDGVPLRSSRSWPAPHAVTNSASRPPSEPTEATETHSVGGTEMCATQTEETNAGVISALRDEVRKAQAQFYNERIFTKILSQQAREMSDLTQTQHSEIRRQEETIKNLRQCLDILQGGTEHIQNGYYNIQKTHPNRVINGNKSGEATRVRINPLEERFSELVREKEELQVQLDREREVTRIQASRIAKLESEAAAVPVDVPPKLWAVQLQTAQTRRQKEESEEMRESLSKFDQDGSVSRDNEVPSDLDVKASCRHVGKAAADGQSDGKVACPEVASRDPLAVPGEKKQEQREGEDGCLDAGAELAGCYPPQRVHARVAAPSSPPLPPARAVSQLPSSVSPIEGNPSPHHRPESLVTQSRPHLDLGIGSLASGLGPRSWVGTPDPGRVRREGDEEEERTRSDSGGDAEPASRRGLWLGCLAAGRRYLPPAWPLVLLGGFLAALRFALPYPTSPFLLIYGRGLKR